MRQSLPGFSSGQFIADRDYPTNGLLDSVVSPLGKEERYFFVKPSDKTKVVKGRQREVGPEYDQDVVSDMDLCLKILANDMYNPTNGGTLDSGIKSAKNNENGNDEGAVIEMTVLGAIGFVALSFSTVGALAADFVGVGMGRYAGKKIIKKLKRKKVITNEDLFVLRLRCLIKMGELQQSEMKHNLNKYRLLLERIVEESAPAFDLSQFKKPEDVSKLLLRLHRYLLRIDNQKATLLTYKLFKTYLKRADNTEAEQEREVVKKVYSMFIPFKKALEFNPKNSKRINKVVTYIKISTLLSNPEVQKILNKHPDPSLDPQKREKFMAKLQETVDLEKEVGAALNWDTRRVHDAIRGGNTGGFDDQQRPVIVSLQALSATRLPKRTLVSFKEPERMQEMKMFSNTNIKRHSFYIPEDELEEGVTIAIRDIPVNVVKLNEERFKIKALDDMNFKNNRETLPGLSLSKPSQSLPQPNRISLPNSLVTGGGAGRMNNALQSILSPIAVQKDGDSSDSSFEEDNNSDEEKKLMDDSYLYLKTSRPKQYMKPTPPKLVLESEISSVDMASEKHIGEPTESRLPKSTLKRTNSRKLSRIGFDTERGNSVADLIKMNSDPDILDVEAIETKKALEDEQRILQSKIIESREAAAPHTQHQASSSRTIDTKQEIIYQKILSISADTHSKWDVIKNTADLKVFKIKPENSNVVLLKAWATLYDSPPKAVFKCIHDTTIRRKWDTVLSNTYVVEKLDENVDVFYFGVKAPFGASNRDFVQRRCYQFDYPEKGDIVISFQSIVHPGAPEIKGTVRGDTHVAGYVIKSKNDGKDSEIYVLSQVDIKGAIPKMIVNAVAGRAPAEWINKLKKAIQDYK